MTDSCWVSVVGGSAASTRTIAARAGVRQGQLTDAEFSTASELHEVSGDADAVTVFESGVRALVRAVSRLPELNRVMVHEAMVDSDRLGWLVDRHVRARFEQLSGLWRQVQADGDTHLDADPVVMYYCLLGAASLLYVNAPEAHHLLGAAGSTCAVTDALIDAHADTVVAMLLGPRPRRATRTRTRTRGM